MITTCLMSTDADTTKTMTTEQNLFEDDFLDIDEIDEKTIMNSEVEELPDIKLVPVKDIQSALGDLSYEVIRKTLYLNYGLIVKDDNSLKDLYMITYNKESHQKHKVELSDENKKLVEQYRGVILEKGTNKLLCYTFDKMHRTLPEEWDLKDCSVMRTYDGSQIKVFYHEKNKKWIISTTRKINAGNAYFFTKKSFLEMFSDASHKLDWNTLNKNYCYSFVLCHPDNRIIKRHNKPYLTHVLTRNMENYELVDENIGAMKPTNVNFKSKKDLFNSLKKLPTYEEGYVVRQGDRFIKVVNLKYQKVKDLRGSSGSLMFQYFKLKKDRNITKFLHYYPEMTEIFNQFNVYFENLCTLIYVEYVNLRIRKIITIEKVLPFLKNALYKLHGQHLEKKKRINLDDVKYHLIEYSPHQLKKMVDEANNLSYFFK